MTIQSEIPSLCLISQKSQLGCADDAPQSFCMHSIKRNICCCRILDPSIRKRTKSGFEITCQNGEARSNRVTWHPVETCYGILVMDVARIH